MSVQIAVPRGGVIVPSSWAEPANEAKRDPFVHHRFELGAVAQVQVRALPYRFGFDGFGETVYMRGYSRRMPNGRQEAWPDTVLRVVNGVFSVRKDHYKKQRLPWDEGFWQSTAVEMAEAIMRMEFLPPGRGLFAMGSDYVYQRGAMALYNCAATTLDDLPHDLGWMMDLLMCGVGVGAETTADRILMYMPSGEQATYAVPDSREGWVESQVLLLRSYCDGSSPIAFDYSQIRPEGAELKGLGGFCAGSEPLRQLHERTREVCERYLRGEYGATRLKADLANIIGCCVVMGNVRRSAEILIGQISDVEFLDLKNYEKHPERAAWGWISNNSVALETPEDFACLPEIAARIRVNGEPGFINRVAMAKFGRFGREMPDRARLQNPCQPGWAPLLTRDGIRVMDEIVVGTPVWTGKQFSKVVSKVATGVKPVFAYHTRTGIFYGTEDHHIVQRGEKVEAREADAIDQCPVDSAMPGEWDPGRVMDGLVFGDGTVHKASNDAVTLIVGQNDGDWLHSEVRDLFAGVHSRKGEATAYRVQTSITAPELPHTYDRRVPQRFVHGDTVQMRSFLRGLYSANGSVCGNRVTLKASSFAVIEAAQVMLSALGIPSYYTTNKSHDVEFGNGTYTCRESYDLNISGGGRRLFRSLIGFLQADKRARLDAVCAVEAQRRKTAYEIVAIEPLGEMPVYDIAVEAEEHTYWTGGLLVSNCSEVPLEHAEVCNLAEVFPTRCPDELSLFRAMKLATLYCSTVSLLPTHRAETNNVVARNRRIGVSVSGIAEWRDDIGMARMTRLLRAGYKVLRAENKRLAVEAGVPESIRVSSVKPSGSISQLAGVSSGMHFPTYKYALRRMRAGRQLPIVQVLKDAGYYVQPDPDEPEKTLVFDFPIDQGKARKATDVSVWEQALLLTALQREWADNGVSCSLYFDPDREGPDLEHVLASIAPMVKSASALPHYRKTVDEGKPGDGIASAQTAYRLMPYEEITKDEYIRRRAMLRPIDWAAFRGDGEDEKFCQGDKCVLPDSK